MVLTLLQSIIAHLPEIIRAGYNILTNLISGIGNALPGIIRASGEVATSFKNAIKKFFGIASPSKRMRDEVGKYIPLGLAVGIEQNSGAVTDAMDNLADLSTGSVQSALRLEASASAAQTATAGKGTVGSITLNVYGAEGQDVNRLADIVMNKLQDAIERREAVFAC